MEYYFTHSLLLATSSSMSFTAWCSSLRTIYCHKDGKQLEALHQVQYWLRFLNVTRMNQAAGKSQVFLVGSHYDKLVGASRSEIAQQFFKLLKGEAKELLNCFDVHYCYMNCTDSSQLEPLCQKLDQAAAIVQSSQKPTVPIICQRVMEEVRQLTICGKVKFILWREFVRTVEQNLADHSEEQLRTAVEYLHNISELLFFPSVCSTHIRQNGDEDPPSTQGILVLDLQWLGNDIFGTFGNVPSSFSLQKQERWSQQDLANLLYLSSTEDLKVVLELLEVLELIVCPGGKEEYIIPAWLTREKGEDIWVESKCSAYYGVAYRWRKDYGLFSQAFFARLQLRLLKQFTSPGEERFRIWKDGIECVDEAKVLAQVSTDRRVINVVGHGLQHNPRDHRALDTKAKCWQLLTVVSAHVEKLLAEAHADSDWDKLYLSPRDMSQRQDSSSSEIAVYTYHDILAAEQQQRSLYSKTSACEDKPWEVLMAGYDVTILSSLERSARVQWLDARTLQELCGLLDPEHPLGKDWKNLMEILGDATSQDIETLESRASRENCSPTRLVFQKFPVTIDRLYSVLKAMGREDCLLEIDSMFHSLKSDPECELLHSS
ncbi:death-associated protein kinase 1-like [Rhinatrema bivittatum]|uniref:death-associated protein kinase 1-like n=1 Tax=Rhinatrema bivittatum TaxID=194408 RepID=UPI00112BBBE1|nr:death-associated protein kinase 1-like [Rhinatrema bivittatum]